MCLLQINMPNNKVQKWDIGRVLLQTTKLNQKTLCLPSSSMWKDKPQFMERKFGKCMLNVSFSPLQVFIRSFLNFRRQFFALHKDIALDIN